MSTESTPAASGSQYALVEGKIYRGGELVATLREDGSVDYAPDMARYRAPVVKFLKSLDGAASSDAGQAENPEEPIPSPTEVVPEPLNEEVPAIDSPEAFGRAFEAIKHVAVERVVEAVQPEPEVEEEPESKAEEKPACSCEDKELSFTEIMGLYPEGAPACDWRGDLTPEFVDWFYENCPDLAERRYAGRFTHRNFEARQAAARDAARGGVI